MLPRSQFHDLAHAVHELSAVYDLEPVAAFLGGSRASLNASDAKYQASHQSDYDILVMVRHLETPMSLNDVALPLHGGKADVIFRDAETLGYDFHVSRYEGTGCIPSIVAKSDVIFDTSGLASDLRETAASLLAHGPVQQDTAREKNDLLRSVLYYDRQEAAPRMLAGYEMVHRAGILHLKSQRDWLGKGKILARHLSAYPETINGLRQSFDAWRDGNAAPLYAQISAIKDIEGEAPHPFYSEQGRFDEAEREDDPIIRCNYLSRCSIAHAKAYYGGDDPVLATIAGKKLARRTAFTVSALTPERYAHRKDEYFFGLCRVVVALGQQMHVTQEDASHDESAMHTAKIASYVASAMEGKPALLRDFIAEQSQILGYDPHEPSMRLEPKTFRATYPGL